MRQDSRSDAGGSGSLTDLFVSVVIPTYRREQVLLDTIGYLRPQVAGRGEIVVVDQTAQHEPAVARELTELDASGAIRWLRRAQPSIPAAMNAGMLAARAPIVIYVDDDVIPDEGFIEAHLDAHRRHPRSIIAGRVLQPWHVSGQAPLDGLAGSEPAAVDEFIGCNFSLPTALGVAAGGFDEQFIKVAYRFEAEFSLRLRRGGAGLQFWPAASLVHLRSGSGGTRSYGDHLRTFLPAHSVGEYYFLLAARPSGWLRLAFQRLRRSVLTRHHLRRPWWIPATLISELGGMAWAIKLVLSGRRLLEAAA